LPAGLFAHDLDITGVKIDGEDVEFELRLSVYEQQEPTEGKQRAHAHMKQHCRDPDIQQTPLKLCSCVTAGNHSTSAC